MNGKLYSVGETQDVVCQNGEVSTFKLIQHFHGPGCGPCSASCDREACYNLGLTCAKIDDVVWERVQE